MNFAGPARPIYMRGDDGCPPSAIVVIVQGDAELTSWPLAGSDGIGGPDLAVVDELARLQLAARRAGCTVRLREAVPALIGLLDLVGLSRTLCVEVSRQPEDLEQRGVEEVVVADDSPVGDLEDLD
jgi:hypothetical protein